METSHRYCVIMCGGVGSRFWPFSRREMPKQFLDFFGTGRSLLQMTVDRILPIVDHDHIVMVTNADYVPLIREQLPQIPSENILAEPARRNTAPCICWAAHHIAARDPEASIVTLPSDHLILKESAFTEAIDKGLSFVETHDALLTLGITPSRPDTGYGYIQQGRTVADCPDFRKVKSFTEKPSLEMAKVLLASGDFYWNAGIFLWSAQSILRAFAKCAPDIAEIFDVGNGLYDTPSETSFIAKAFPNAPAISVDYAIMERADNVYILAVDLGWSDLGTWNALYETSPKNRDGNVAQNCRLLAEDCTGSVFAVRGDKVIVADGLRDYIVADSDDALLIYPLAKEQEIRRVVNDIRSRFGEKYT